MSELRDVIIFYSKKINHAYVTTNIQYMNLSGSELINIFKNKQGSSEDGGNSNFEQRNNLPSVTDIVLSSDFKFETQKKQGLAGSDELSSAKALAEDFFKKCGYKTANGIRTKQSLEA